MFLQVLNLAQNQIDSLQGLESLHDLRDLNLAANPIRSLGFCLTGLQHLCSINLAATEIDSFEALWQLSLIGSLLNLCLCDPVWGVAPLTQLPKYRPRALVQIQNLTSLDLVTVQQVEKALKICLLQIHPGWNNLLQP